MFVNIVLIFIVFYENVIYPLPLGNASKFMGNKKKSVYSEILL